MTRPTFRLVRADVYPNLCVLPPPEPSWSRRCPRPLKSVEAYASKMIQEEGGEWQIWVVP